MTRHKRNGEKPDAESVISFGPFLLVGAKRLLDRRVRVRLDKRALDVLLVLVEHAPRTVSNKELTSTVWPDRAVNTENLRPHVAALRRALGGGGSSRRYVAGVLNRGYRFVAPMLRARLTPSTMENVPLGLGARSSYALDDKRLRRVLDFLEANLENDIRVEHLASAAALSKFHFSRAFRQATGKTPHRFVRERRIERAKELLVEGTASLADIALICNFSSQVSFTKALTRAVGLSPGEYRRGRRRTSNRDLSPPQDRLRT